MTLAGENRNTRSKRRTSATFSTKNFTWTGLGKKPGSPKREASDWPPQPWTARHIILFLSSFTLFFPYSSFLLFFYSFLLSWTVLLQCQPTPLQQNASNQTTTAGDPFSFAYRPVYESLACCRNETVNESDSSQVSADRSKRSADDDSSNGDGDTAEDESDDTTPDTNQEEDDAITEDSAEDPPDTR